MVRRGSGQFEESVGQAEANRINRRQGGPVYRRRGEGEWVLNPSYDPNREYRLTEQGTYVVVGPRQPSPYGRSENYTYLHRREYPTSFYQYYYSKW